MASSRKSGMQTYNALDARFRKHAALYGYEVVETDIVQNAELFLTRAGDQIITRLFTFDHQGSNLALRPEFTAAAAFTYVRERYRSPVRWQFSGMVFEDDPLSSGSLQRHSFGAELIGLGGVLAETEVIALAYSSLNALDLKDVSVVVGNVALMRHLLATFGLDSRTTRFLLNHIADFSPGGRGSSYVLDALDRLLFGHHEASEDLSRVSTDIGESPDADFNTQQMLNVLLDATQRGATMGGRSRHDIARRLIQKRQRATERPQIIAAMQLLSEWCQIDADPVDALTRIRALVPSSDAVAHGMIAEMALLVKLLGVAGIEPERVRLQPALARNWDYYTGMVFDLRAGEQHVGGGGRYDELARLIGGEYDVPAVGFACYSDVVVALAQLPDIHPAPTWSLYGHTDSDEACLQWASALRSQGIGVVVSATPHEGSLIAQSDGRLTFAGRDYEFTQLEELARSLGNQAWSE